MNDLARQNVKGPVSTLRLEIAEWDSDTNSWKPPRHSSMTHFRSDGQISEVEYQHPDGSISRSTRDYDDAGRATESRNRTNNGPETKDLYQYDNSGRLIRVVAVDQLGAQSDAATYSYDDSGRKTAKLFLSIDLDNGSMAFSASSDGDSQQSDETIWYDIKHRFLRRVTFTRDSSGKLLKEDIHLDESSFGGFGQASPEEREALMAAMTKLLGADRVMASTSYVYDNLGRTIERRIQIASLGDDRTTYQYDDHGNPVEEVRVNTQREMQSDESGNSHLINETSQTNRIHYDYQYDAYGNWTERIVSSRSDNSSPLQCSNVERREISYYPVP